MGFSDSMIFAPSTALSLYRTIGAPSPTPVMPPEAIRTYRLSRYSLDDMVVVHVCLSLRRTTSVVTTLPPAEGATAAPAAVIINVRRFICFSWQIRTPSSSAGR